MVQGATTKDGPLYFFRFGNTIFTCNLVITYLEDCWDNMKQPATILVLPVL